MAENFFDFTNFNPTHPLYGNIEDEDLNPQEESRPLVSDASASSSTINEANKKTDSSSASSKFAEIGKRKLSPYAKPWSPDNFRQPYDETFSYIADFTDEDRAFFATFEGFLNYDCTDAMFSNIEDGEASRPGLYMPVSSSARNPETGYKNQKLSALAPPFIHPSEENLMRNQFPWNQMMDPQLHVTITNLGSPYFSSNPNYFGRPLQFSPNAVPWDSQNAFQQHQMQVYVPPVFSIQYPQPYFASWDSQTAFQQHQMQVYEPPEFSIRDPQPYFATCDPHQRPMDQNIFPRSSPVQAPMPSQLQNPLQGPMPFPMQYPVGYPYQRPMANQENQYQHPMTNMSELNRQQVLQPGLQTEQPMADMSEFNRQQELQPEPQSTEQKQTKTEESDAWSSSHQSGRDQK